MKLNLVIVAVGLLVSGCCGMGSKRSDSSDPAPNTSAQTVAAAVAAPAPKAIVAPTVVDISKLLSEYKDNEVRADTAYKGKLASITGKVGAIKKSLGDSMYLTVGTGKQFEIPEVHCMLEDSQKAKASALSRGSTVTIVGRIDGLMMNVIVKGCVIQ